ncbi:excinuclease ABC subunit UvrB [Streptomyces bauhiniae]|uniref:Excinuclease ABC subunit UvrB n=1 Tax=Streptomyces bauhiniae TaxID=2340725 RepID=A0A4Z1D4T1_9ACTN|nr:excinuclease ABC subunit UvrB [Streptomyces bauhiniae]TGN76731.1 excinuclease ABC subunit UvrB [Streptomyces bauhiniae]
MAFPSENRRITLAEHTADQVIRAGRPFQVVSPHTPSGDQPQAIAGLEKHLRAGESDVVLLGATGTGKSATTAWLIEKLQRPTLVLAPNKTLAGQLANELRELFPHNAVEYFVSFYDHYRPESYAPSTDTYFAKESVSNKEVDRLRHSATWSLLSRRDVIVVASVSCIYGLGTPQSYLDRSFQLAVGDTVDREELLAALVDIQYTRTDGEPAAGRFRVRGDTIDIHPAYENTMLRVEMFGDTVERLTVVDPETSEVREVIDRTRVFPATHYFAGPERMRAAADSIQAELKERVAELTRAGKLLEADRLQTRTEYDIELIRHTQVASGMENYSRHLDGRAPGAPPSTLLDYFPEDMLVVIDESHVTVPQLSGMSHGDAARKNTLVEHGFRLPSAMDNRPLTWSEFAARCPQRVYLSATPGRFELTAARGAVVEQIIRPTGLLDPQVTVKPTAGQMDDLLAEIRERSARGERTLVTTLTKRMSEELTDYLDAEGVRVRYLHSGVTTLRRVELLADLRRGEYDVLVGINLLREGLDLPEVSLVAILDADQDGIFRNDTALIQMIGRAARNVSGEVHMYANRLTPSMARAIDETNRRRALQIAHNETHGIRPTALRKKIRHTVSAQYAESQHPTTGTSYNRRMAA